MRKRPSRSDPRTTWQRTISTCAPELSLTRLLSAHGRKKICLRPRTCSRMRLGRDPAFLLAYYQLARAQDQIYFLGIDHTPERLALADAAVQTTLRLRPESGEAHLALAQHLYWGYRDYDRAREELAIARRALPNEPLVLLLAGYIDRRQGRWEQSIKEMERALELDPRNLFILQQISFSYDNLRRYKEMAVTFGPRSDHSSERHQYAGRAGICRSGMAGGFAATALCHSRDTGGEIRRAAPELTTHWMLLALCERDSAARRALAAIGADGNDDLGVKYPKAWYEGIVARAHR